MYKESALTFRRIVQYGLIFLVAALVIGYAAWQARLLIIGPVITFTEEPATIQKERVVTISGQAANIVGITLNGRAIYTDKNGSFKEDVILENGYTVITLEGIDRYGRTNVVTRKFVYTPDPNV